MPEANPKDIPLHLHQWKWVEYTVVNKHLVSNGGWVCIICGSMTILEDRQYYV